MFPIDSFYGRYRTNTFNEEFPTVEDFIDFYKNNGGIAPTIAEESARTLYYLLSARYGECHIAMSSYNRFKYSVMAIIFQYGPTWEKRYDIQNRIRHLSIEEIQEGTLAVTNNALNPGNKLTEADELIKNVNNQSRTNYKISKLNAYAKLYELLATDVTGDFIDKFNKLFSKFSFPSDPLFYDIKEEN